MSPKEFAHSIGVHPQTVWRWIKGGRIKAKRKTPRGRVDIDQTELATAMVEYAPNRKAKAPSLVSHEEPAGEVLCSAHPVYELPPDPPPDWATLPLYETLVARWKAPADAWEALGEPTAGERIEPFLIRKFREVFGGKDDVVIPKKD